MSERRIPPPAPDQAVRDRLVRDFETNFLVEAAAGSGKTESLAQRMAAGIAVGRWSPDAMAAVTFTRKAAAELRARVQLALEARLAGAAEGSPERTNAARGLASIERIFAGTIHAFCARLLRERPVEAQMAPDFREIDEIEDAALRRQAWRDYLARARALGSPALAALQAAGVRPVELDAAFAHVCEHADVAFPAGEVDAPALAPAWHALEAFWRDLLRLTPQPIDPATTCKVQQLVPEFDQRLRFASRRRGDVLAGLLREWDHGSLGFVNKWWGNGQSRGNPGAAEAKATVERFRDGVARGWLETWQQHVYRLAIDVLLQAREFYAERRRQRNVVNYTDLLVAAARMLREQPLVRRQLQDKVRWVFVDEFQDTDPVQAEIFLWLAGEDVAGGDGRAASPIDPWSVPLRPGALFVVGDPKQSIYRFRRADIDVYLAVRDRITASGGAVVRLTANFRSLPGACALANDYFPRRFPAATPHSPAFDRLEPVRRESGDTAAGPYLATLITPGNVARSDVVAFEAHRIARFIRSEVDSARRRYGDFLVLARQRPRLHQYATVFDGCGIPVEVSGAGRFGQSAEVTDLALLLRAIADPADQTALVGALRGRFFGLSDEALFAFRAAGGRLDLAAVPPAAEDPAEAARLAATCGPTLSAVRALRHLAGLTRRLPLAVAIDRIVEDTGWLALAATSQGGAGGGHVLQAVDRVRDVAEQGGGLLDAVEALEAEEESSDAESLPLEPGRRDVVRVMNLHKAKGLEAPVVFLADPANAYRFPVDLRIVRQHSVATGYLLVQRKREGDYGATLIARPEGWQAHEEDETRYRNAEEQRLLYVASTRARDLLVVSRWDRPIASGRNPNEAWGDFDRCLHGVAELPVPATASVPTRRCADLSPAARDRAERRRQASHDVARQPSSAVLVVTTEAERLNRSLRPAGKREDQSAPEAVAERMADADYGRERAAGPPPSLVVLGASTGEALHAIVPDTPSHQADRDAAWGVLLHGLLEHAMRVRDREVSAEELTRLAQWLAIERPELREHVGAAVEIALAATRAPFWREARTAEHHVEVPFAVRLAPGEAPPGGEPVTVPTLLRGVIDLVHTTADGWAVRDYKTGTLDAETLKAKYGRQIETYRWVWGRSVGGEDL
jgi:ATP-dependent helicase/nuclease subunit A